MFTPGNQAENHMVTASTLINALLFTFKDSQRQVRHNYTRNNAVRVPVSVQFQLIYDKGERHILYSVSHTFWVQNTDYLL